MGGWVVANEMGTPTQPDVALRGWAKRRWRRVVFPQPRRQRGLLAEPFPLTNRLPPPTSGHHHQPITSRGLGGAPSGHGAAHPLPGTLSGQPDLLDGVAEANGLVEPQQHEVVVVAATVVVGMDQRTGDGSHGARPVP